MAKHALFIALLAIVGGVFSGCSGSSTDVSKKEEEDFRNPPKEIPPESLKAMQEAREKGMKKAAEMRGQK